MTPPSTPELTHCSRCGKRIRPPYYSQGVSWQGHSRNPLCARAGAPPNATEVEAKEARRAG